MKHLRIELFFIFCLLLPRVQAQNYEYDYCVRGVNIINAHAAHPVLFKRDVYIRGNKILKISKSSGQVSKNTRQIIDGQGKFLMPGLVDMHVHLPKENIEKALLMNLAAGVTAVRSMRGDTAHVRLKKRIASGDLTGPDLFISAPPIHPKTPVKKEELPETVAGYKEQGFDLIKILGVPDSLYFEAVMAAANSAGMKVAGHSPKQVPVERIIQTGYSSIEHLQGLIEIYQKDTSAIDPIIDELRKKGVYNCPTLDWYNISYMQASTEELKKRKGLEYADEKEAARWIKQIESYHARQSLRNKDSVLEEQAQGRKNIQARLNLLKKLSGSGAPLLFSPDATGLFGIPGFSVFEEIKLYNKAGLSNKDILKIVTYNPAEYFGQTRDWGSVNEGMKANLILLSGNPLESIDNIESQEAIFINGKYFTNSEIHTRLKK